MSISTSLDTTLFPFNLESQEDSKFLFFSQMHIRYKLLKLFPVLNYSEMYLTANITHFIVFKKRTPKQQIRSSEDTLNKLLSILKNYVYSLLRRRKLVYLIDASSFQRKRKCVNKVTVLLSTVQRSYQVTPQLKLKINKRYLSALNFRRNAELQYFKVTVIKSTIATHSK